MCTNYMPQNDFQHWVHMHKIATITRGGRPKILLILLYDQLFSRYMPGYQTLQMHVPTNILNTYSQVYPVHIPGYTKYLP